ncbi:MAG TPA: hypothetical protein VL346_06395 [Acidobacteriaceae bacterium]|nr:hypothetical protein [Acidobacteriaceae bacterium]
MSSYSAAQVISPAIQRTRWYLFQPFRLGRFLKLALVAAITEGGGISGCNFGSRVPSSNGGGNASPPFHWPTLHWPAMHWPALPVILGVIALVCAIVIPLWLLLSYLFIRLRFSYFDCVLRGQDQIAPAWRRYHRQALRYLGMSLCIGLAFWIVLIPIGYALYRQYAPLFQSLFSGGKPDFAQFVPLILIVIAGVLGLGLAGYLLQTTLSCFVLPRMALQDASIRESLEDVWADIQLEPGQFCLFYLLRALLWIAASFASAIVLIVPFILLGIIGAILIVAMKAVSTAAALAVGIPLGILFVCAFVAASIGVSGTIGTFNRNYALFFYAGRFPGMAAILWPPQPPPPPPYWAQAAPPAV